jgi:hypothetical protein
VRAGNDEQLGEAAQHEPVAVAPVQRGGGDGEAEFGEPVQQRPESEPALRVPGLAGDPSPAQPEPRLLAGEQIMEADRLMTGSQLQYPAEEKAASA